MDQIRNNTYCRNENNDLITLKKAEEALRIHKILFEIAQDIILYIGLDGQIMDFNQRAYEKYGYTKQQLLSMKIQDIRHPSTASEYERQMLQADTSGVVFECVHVKSGGGNYSF
jgi:PAS domain S-box-containing protein